MKQCHAINSAMPIINPWSMYEGYGNLCVCVWYHASCFKPRFIC